MEPKYHKLFLSCRLLVLVGVREVFLLELVWVPIVDHWASIHLVVSNRVAERFQMHSDLMSSPRLWIALNHRVIGLLVVRDELEEGLRRLGLRSMLEWNFVGLGTTPKSFNIGNAVHTQVALDCQLLGF